MRLRISTELYRLVPAGLLAVCVAIAKPVVELGINDDWSYIWSARSLAETGHVQYNGWATAMLGWQLYLGAAFIRLFGFSFTVVRVPVFLLSLGTIFLLQRLFVRCGIAEWNAMIATSVVALSPFFLPLVFTFMSDVPGFFCIVLCLYLCIRAMQARTTRVSILWLVAAALSNALDGTVRQIAWLGVLVIVPSTTLYLRGRRGVLAAGTLSCLAGVAMIAAFMHWFKLQPYALVEKTFALKMEYGAYLAQVRLLSKAVLALLLFLSPVLAAFLWRFPWRLSRARRQGAVAVVLLALFCVFQIHLGIKSSVYLSPFLGNTVSAKGILDVPASLGTAPEVVSGVVRFALGILLVCGFAAWLICRWTAFGLGQRANERQDAVPGKALVYLLGPYTLAYLFLLVTRSSVFDRYLLPLSVVGLVVLVRGYQSYFGGKLPWVSVALIAALAGFAVAGMHDTFTYDRARLRVIEQIREAGIPRSEIRAGFEYDAWTELEQSGYINEPRLVLPAGAFRPPVPPRFPPECRYYFEDPTPSVHGRYGLATEQVPCFGQAPFPRVQYRTWLAPRERQILVVSLR